MYSKTVEANRAKARKKLDRNVKKKKKEKEKRKKRRWTLIIEEPATKMAARASGRFSFHFLALF